LHGAASPLLTPSRSICGPAAATISSTALVAEDTSGAPSGSRAQLIARSIFLHHESDVPLDNQPVRDRRYWRLTVPPAPPCTKRSPSSFFVREMLLGPRRRQDRAFTCVAQPIVTKNDCRAGVELPAGKSANSFSRNRSRFERHAPPAPGRETTNGAGVTSAIHSSHPVCSALRNHVFSSSSKPPSGKSESLS